MTMLEIIMGIFEKFGLPVAFLIVMIWLFTKADAKFSKERESHRGERDEWRTSQSQLQSDTNDALKDLTKAISHLERKI